MCASSPPYLSFPGSSSVSDRELLFPVTIDGCCDPGWAPRGEDGLLPYGEDGGFPYGEDGGGGGYP